MSTPSVRPVRGRADLRRFIDVPWRVYSGLEDSRWIPPLRVMVRDTLDTGKDPFWRRAERELFLAERGGEVVGRIAAIHNRGHNEHHGDRVGFFGFFECEDDPEAARALFDAASAWLAGRGLRSARGPMNPSTNHECGLLVRGFRWEPFFLTPWTPRYYIPLVEGAGFRRVKELLAYFLPADPERFELPESVGRIAERTRRDQRVTYRTLTPATLTREAELCRQIYNEAWDGNWGFFPMTREEFAHIARELKPLIRSDFAFIADVEGEPAAFLVVLPDANQILKRIPSGRLFPFGLIKLLVGRRRLRTGRIILFGVRKRFQRGGLFALLTDELRRRARSLDMIGAEASWILEDNEALTGLLRKMGVKPTKRWAIYEREIEPGIEV